MPVQCSDGTVLCQKITICLLGPIVGTGLVGVEDPILILPDNTKQDLLSLLRMMWDKV